jgi:outer membrane protein insertion porin family
MLGHMKVTLLQICYSSPLKNSDPRESVLLTGLFVGESYRNARWPWNGLRSWVAAALLIPALACAAGAQAPPKPIRQIRIEGLKREPEGDLLARLRIRVGDPFNERQVSEQTGELYSTGKFKQVENRFEEREDGWAVTFVVVERLLVSTAELRGREELSEKHLSTEPPALQTRKGGLLSESHVADDADVLRQKYHEAGYIFAQVESRIVRKDDTADVVFLIDEGSRVRIRKVEFFGNDTVAASTLLRLMNTREKDTWFFGLIRPGFYDYNVLRADLRNLESYYGSIGFFDARAEPEEVYFDYGRGRIRISIQIQEGPRYTFTGYSLRGNRVFLDQTLLDLTTAVGGLPFDAQVMERDRRAILDYYGDRAYIEAKVEPRPLPNVDTRTVSVAFEITEKNEVYVDEVTIRGNVKTQDRVIRRELEVNPGERVDRSKLVKSRSNLNRLQIFKNVRYSFEGASQGEKDLIWQVEEEPSGRLVLGFGVTSGFGVIGNFSITKRNFDPTDWPESLYELPESFTGGGQTLSLVAQPGTRRSLYRFSLTEPYLFETKNSLTLAASSLTIARDDYDEGRTSFSPQLAHALDFDRDLVFSVGHRLEEVEISRLDFDAPSDAVAADGFTTVIAASTGISYNKVLFEHLEGPYDGSNNAVLYEYAGGLLGGEVDFHKFEVTNEVYYPIYEYTRGPETFHHVVSLINRYGMIEPEHTADTVPIFERFFLGGPNSVRGFRFRGLGPHENNNPIGGTGMLYGNLEYSFPLFQKLLRGVFFLDYGNLSPNINELSTGRMRYAVGGGFRVNFPFLGQPLPIGLYLGTPIAKEPDDRTRVFLFTIGAPF